MGRHIRHGTLLLSVLATSACGHGALGQATFADGCGPEGASCARRGFEAPIAVGATLRPEVRLDLQGAGTPAAHYQSVAADVLRAERGLLEGRAAGVSAVLLVTDSGTVLDFFHVWVKRPTHLRLFLRSTVGAAEEELTDRVELLAGESVRLSASLFGDGQALAGDAEQQWTLDEPIAAVLYEGTSGRRRIVAREPGRGTLRVRSLDQTAFVDVVVHPAKGELVRAGGTDR